MVLSLASEAAPCPTTRVPGDHALGGITNQMEGTYFDRALLVTCIDGLGRFVKEGAGLVYRKDVDTLGVTDAHLAMFLL